MVDASVVRGDIVVVEEETFLYCLAVSATMRDNGIK